MNNDFNIQNIVLKWRDGSSSFSVAMINLADLIVLNNQDTYRLFFYDIVNDEVFIDRCRLPTIQFYFLFRLFWQI